MKERQPRFLRARYFVVSTFFAMLFLELTRSWTLRSSLYFWLLLIYCISSCFSLECKDFHWKYVHETQVNFEKVDRQKIKFYTHAHTHTRTYVHSLNLVILLYFFLVSTSFYVCVFTKSFILYRRFYLYFDIFFIYVVYNELQRNLLRSVIFKNEP